MLIELPDLSKLVNLEEIDCSTNALTGGRPVCPTRATAPHFRICVDYPYMIGLLQARQGCYVDTCGNPGGGTLVGDITVVQHAPKLNYSGLGLKGTRLVRVRRTITTTLDFVCWQRSRT